MTRRISRKSSKNRVRKTRNKRQRQSRRKIRSRRRKQTGGHMNLNMKHLANNAEQWLLGGTKPLGLMGGGKKKRRKSKRKSKSKSKSKRRR